MYITLNTFLCGVEGGETCTLMHATSTPCSRYTIMNFINICTDDDADLEAELLALEGKAPKKGGNSKAGGRGHCRWLMWTRCSLELVTLERLVVMTMRT